jgi:hypothetical protein
LTGNHQPDRLIAEKKFESQRLPKSWRITRAGSMYHGRGGGGIKFEAEQPHL